MCDDKFNNTAADVICREVGFGCATTWFQGRFEVSLISYHSLFEHTFTILDFILILLKGRLS